VAEGHLGAVCGGAAGRNVNVGLLLTPYVDGGGPPGGLFLRSEGQQQYAGSDPANTRPTAEAPGTAHIGLVEEAFTAVAHTSPVVGAPPSVPQSSDHSKPGCRLSNTLPGPGATYRVPVRIQGGTHQAMADYGCAQSMIHQSLVRSTALVKALWVYIWCVHGDVHLYPIVSVEYRHNSWNWS